MPYAQAPGARLYYESTGSGHPIVFVHEFASDYRNWETQVRYFSRQYQCITFNARGYPPSDVPTSPDAYGYTFAADDIGAVMDAAGVQRAHVMGVSQGAYATLMFGLRHPSRATALVATGCGSGAWPPEREQFIAHTLEAADRFLKEGTPAMAAALGKGPTRIQLLNKDPRGWDEFTRWLSEHSAEGSAHTMREYQSKRPSFFDMKAELAALTIPTLLVCGDEDDPCVETNVFLKRAIPTAGLWMVPKTGHAVNLEEPGLFNQGIQDFFGMVERGRWGPRDPGARGTGGAFTAHSKS